MLSFFRRLRGAIIISLLSGAAWVPAGAVLAVIGLYVINRASPTPLPVSVVWQSALRGVVVFGAWGVLSGALTAVAVAAMARRRNHAPLSLSRTIAYAAVGQSMLLISARLFATLLPWHRVAVALREIPLPVVALGGAAIVGGGLLVLHRTENVPTSA